MTEQTKFRVGRLATLALPALLAGGAALAQTAGPAADAPPTSGIACRDLIAMPPEEGEKMLYFIAGYQAALDGAAGAGVDATKGVINTEAGGTAEAPVDPRLGQVVPLESGSGLVAIDRERVWGACQENPDRPAGEVLKELSGSGMEAKQ